MEEIQRLIEATERKKEVEAERVLLERERLEQERQIIFTIDGVITLCKDILVRVKSMEADRVRTNSATDRNLRSIERSMVAITAILQGIITWMPIILADDGKKSDELQTRLLNMIEKTLGSSDIFIDEVRGDIGEIVGRDKSDSKYK